ncbi:uncharacterized protein LOC131943163 [Physella acuta]|uniref:uncharacterized protein LOC131943163 n=1 Tax=Physella acuta TaxID=109671 RepID=UPI0027DC9018|nr:uncharacterized protein LOC131943163 [Physella acuta]
MCKRALKIKEHSKVLFVIGKAYAKLNQIDRALKLQRRALKLDPSSKDILKELCSLTNHKLKELLLERQSLQLMLDSSEVNTPPVRKDASCCKRVRTDISQDDRRNLSSKKARVESLKGENITLLSNIGYMLCGFKTTKVPSETINSIVVTSPRGTVNLNTYANPEAEDQDE